MMGGLIDTAIKSSQTGNIQRRLVKGHEDIKVEYGIMVFVSAVIIVLLRNHYNSVTEIYKPY